jgi:electron transfer flavoprotein alpha subunit
MAKDILVVAEQQRQKLDDVTFELLGLGKQLAGKSGGGLAVALLGGNAALAAQLGAAGKVLHVDHPVLNDFNPEAHGAALVEVVGQAAPSLVLVANTSMGMDLAALLSARKDLPLVAYTTQVGFDGGRFVATSQLYGGKVFAESVLDQDGGVVSVLAGAYPADAGRAAGAPPVTAVAVPALDGTRLRFVGLIEPEGGDVDITQHDVLVAVGRGIQNQDNLPMVEALAKALGGAVCSSRPIVDSKWLPKTRQVGKSGLKVKPKVYLMLGISGAPEHLEGMKDSELIIAVNTDASAPIFAHAHYGTTADLFELVPALTKRLA